jgi:hypothetical protein
MKRMLRRVRGPIARAGAVEMYCFPRADMVVHGIYAYPRAS